MLRDYHVDYQEVEFSRPYRVLHVKILTKIQSVLSRWKQASRYIFATQTDVKLKLSSGDSDIQPESFSFRSAAE